MTVGQQTAGIVPSAYSSVEITRNSRGYTWSVKCYVEPGSEELALDRARSLEHALAVEYGPRSEVTGGK